jgi:hypothetical protein
MTSILALNIVYNDFKALSSHMKDPITKNIQKSNILPIHNCINQF